jgi:hypothetical protein
MLASSLTHFIATQCRQPSYASRLGHVLVQFVLQPSLQQCLHSCIFMWFCGSHHVRISYNILIHCNSPRDLLRDSHNIKNPTRTDGCTSLLVQVAWSDMDFKFGMNGAQIFLGSRHGRRGAPFSDGCWAGEAFFVGRNCGAATVYLICHYHVIIVR